jgi:hypothetical protein
LALAFGHYGTRVSGGHPGHPPVVDGADSTLAGEMPRFALPRGGPTALEIPLVDEADRLRGILVAEGGPAHRMVWVGGAAAPGPRWNLVLDRLAAADSAAREPNATVVHGVTRAFLLGSTVAFAQPSYRWTPGAIPRLLHVAYLVNDTARVAPTLRQARGVALPAGVAARASAVETRRNAVQLYEAMRDALRRGDWTAFGKAFDALGILLQRPVP